MMVIGLLFLLSFVHYNYNHIHHLFVNNYYANTMDNPIKCLFYSWLAIFNTEQLIGALISFNISDGRFNTKLLDTLINFWYRIMSKYRYWCNYQSTPLDLFYRTPMWKNVNSNLYSTWLSSVGGGGVYRTHTRYSTILYWFSNYSVSCRPRALLLLLLVSCMRRDSLNTNSRLYCMRIWRSRSRYRQNVVSVA